MEVRILDTSGPTQDLFFLPVRRDPTVEEQH